MTPKQPVRFDSNEEYPVFRLVSKESNVWDFEATSGDTYELSAAEIANYRRIAKEWYDWQTRIRIMVRWND